MKKFESEYDRWCKREYQKLIRLWASSNVAVIEREPTTGAQKQAIRIAWVREMMRDPGVKFISVYAWCLHDANSQMKRYSEVCRRELGLEFRQCNKERLETVDGKVLSMFFLGARRTTQIGNRVIVLVSDEIWALESFRSIVEKELCSLAKMDPDVKVVVYVDDYPDTTTIDTEESISSH